jgi:hypothetical protein
MIVNDKVNPATTNPHSDFPEGAAVLPGDNPLPQLSVIALTRRTRSFLIPHSPDKSNQSAQTFARSGIRKSAADFPHTNGPSTAPQCYSLRACCYLFPDIRELLQYQ